MFWLSFSCCLDGVCVTDFDRGGGTNAFLDVEEDGTEDGGGASSPAAKIPFHPWF